MGIGPPHWLEGPWELTELNMLPSGVGAFQVGEGGGRQSGGE